MERPTRGHYMAPALFLAQPERRVARVEIFGPVAVVLRADHYEHALALANDTSVRDAVAAQAYGRQHGRWKVCAAEPHR